jgi:hypothetical protein
MVYDLLTSTSNKEEFVLIFDPLFTTPSSRRDKTGRVYVMCELMQPTTTSNSPIKC